jgi:TrmH family RNA methyltransferase
MKNVINFEDNVITSRQNPYILYVCKLADKKHRQKDKKFRLDGIKLFIEAVKAETEIESILISESAKDKILSGFENFLIIATERGASIKLVSDGVFEKISEEKSPEGIMCVVKHIDKLHKIATIDNIDIFFDNNLKDNDNLFALESIRDPGNLGTIIRSSVAFGVDVLLISFDCADIYNPKTIRAAMGTLFRQRIIIVDDMARALKSLSLRGRRIYAAALARDSKLLGGFELSKKDCIVVGNEGHGLSMEVIDACDETVLIPMTEGAESLNAAIASSVCLWEQFGRKL